MGQINENYLFRKVGSLTRHSGHVWTLGAHAPQMMWESGHMKIRGLAGSRQMGQVRSSSFFSITSLRNLTISALGASIFDVGFWSGDFWMILLIGCMRNLSWLHEPFFAIGHVNAMTFQNSKPDVKILWLCAQETLSLWYWLLLTYTCVSLKPNGEVSSCSLLTISCSGFSKLVRSSFPNV